VFVGCGLEVNVCVAVGGTTVGLGVFVGAGVLEATIGSVGTDVFVGAVVFVSAGEGATVVAIIATCVAGTTVSVKASVAADVLSGIGMSVGMFVLVLWGASDASKTSVGARVGTIAP
jgi:hypothetical protein